MPCSICKKSIRKTQFKHAICGNILCDSCYEKTIKCPCCNMNLRLYVKYYNVENYSNINYFAMVQEQKDTDFDLKNISILMNKFKLKGSYSIVSDDKFVFQYNKESDQYISKLVIKVDDIVIINPIIVKEKVIKPNKKQRLIYYMDGSVEEEPEIHLLDDRSYVHTVLKTGKKIDAKISKKNIELFRIKYAGRIPSHVKITTQYMTLVNNALPNFNP